MQTISVPEAAPPAASTPSGTGARQRVLNATVLIAGLGYFVDMFDLTLFGVVRVSSLRALGVTNVLEVGVLLVDLQMIGMLLGGVFWGILGDKKGRISVLFGSILVYSLANLANAFVTNVPLYGVLRFIAGFGLAGELGAAITLVSEVMSKEQRGYGTTIIATLGLLGAVAASLTGQLLSWKVAYLVGGVLGLLLLVARFKTFESGMFAHAQKKTVRKGDPRMLLKERRWLRYLCCILVGVPIWFMTGVLLTFAPELTADLQLTGPVTAGNALLYGSIGLTLGDLASGLLSQTLKSRKKAVGAFLACGALLAFAYSQARGVSPSTFYALCFCVGLCAGYWAVFVTIAAEQFGTNLRSTVATTAPNFVRASLVLVTLGFVKLKAHLPVMPSALAVGAVCFVLALVGLILLPETYGKNLDYLEE
jgi:MFS transporter, putative metabolite:H+ symporter